jgi:hypothetical protein
VDDRAHDMEFKKIQGNSWHGYLLRCIIHVPSTTTMDPASRVPAVPAWSRLPDGQNEGRMKTVQSFRKEEIGNTLW